jgi:hypothetical protein
MTRKLLLWSSVSRTPFSFGCVAWLGILASPRLLFRPKGHCSSLVGGTQPRSLPILLSYCLSLHILPSLLLVLILVLVCDNWFNKKCHPTWKISNDLKEKMVT